MPIPPLGIGRTPAFMSGGHAPKEELKVLLETMGQIHTQMGKNSGNPQQLAALMEEYHATVGNIDQFLKQLPPSEQGVFTGHLEQLSAHMDQYYDALLQGASPEAAQQNGIAATTLISYLHQDIGLTPPKSLH